MAIRYSWAVAAVLAIASLEFANAAVADDPPPAAPNDATPANPPPGEAPAAAAPAAKTPAAKNAGADVVVATVGDRPIYERQVQTMLAAAVHGISLGGEDASRRKAAILAALVERGLVEAYFDEKHLTAAPAEVDAQLAHVKGDLERAKRPWDKFLSQNGQTEATIRAEMRWELSWQKYLKQQLTDDAMEAYFKAHSREFDGTQLRVSHILFRPPGAGDAAAMAALMKQAEEVRQEIADGKLDFQAAAEKYSAGPSRSRGGDLGIIGRHGPMVEQFSRAAFALEKDQISPPVTTASGVHLIRVTLIKPGDNAWTDVKEELRPALIEHLFEQLVALQRGNVPIRFTGKGPYFKPGTTELVTPK